MLLEFVQLNLNIILVSFFFCLNFWSSCKTLQNVFSSSCCSRLTKPSSLAVFLSLARDLIEINAVTSGTS